GAGRAILERIAAPTDVHEMTTTRIDIRQPGDDHQAGFAPRLAAGVALPGSQLHQLEPDVIPAGAGGGHFQHGAVGGSRMRANAQAGHQRVPRATRSLLVTPAKAGVQRPRALEQPRHWMTRCARPFGAASSAFCALRAGPAFAGMTGARKVVENVIIATPPRRRAPAACPGPVARRCADRPGPGP